MKYGKRGGLVGMMPAKTWEGGSGGCGIKAGDNYSGGRVVCGKGKSSGRMVATAMNKGLDRHNRDPLKPLQVD